MDEVIWKLARQVGIDDVDVRKLRMFAELLIDMKDAEIDILKSKVFVLQSQNEIYRDAINDSF